MVGEVARGDPIPEIIDDLELEGNANVRGSLTFPAKLVELVILAVEAIPRNTVDPGAGRR